MHRLHPADKVIVYSDVPPLGNEGVSMSVLAHRIIASMEPNVSQIITRVYSKKYPRAQIGSRLQAPTLLSWDCGGKGLRFIKGNWRFRLDALLLRAWHRLSYHQPAGTRAVELVGLSGPHWQFLPRLRDLAKDMALPYSVYVIDDYEVTAEHSGADEREMEACRRIIGDCLRQASRVFAICPGMAERLRSRYGVGSRVLYPVADAAVDGSGNETVKCAPIHELVYVGSLGPAYLDTLTEIATMLEAGGAPEWRLKIISQDRRTFARVFSDNHHVVARHNCDRDQLRKEIASAEAMLIPYSFESRWATTAETSFPSKFMDAIVAGKPIVVLAPPLASITRHMQDAGAGFCVNTTTDCGRLLAGRPWAITDEWRQTYATMFQRHHSCEAARTVLFS